MPLLNKKRSRSVRLQRKRGGASRAAGVVKSVAGQAIEHFTGVNLGKSLRGAGTGMPRRRRSGVSARDIKGARRVMHFVKVFGSKPKLKLRRRRTV